MAQSQQSQIDYTIYSTEMPGAGQSPGAAQAGEQTSDMDKALKNAEQLFSTGKFLKVEVKKKYTEEKTGRQIEITLKVFEGKVKKDRSVLILSIVAVLAGAGAFSGAYFLTKQPETASPEATAESGAGTAVPAENGEKSGEAPEHPPAAEGAESSDSAPAPASHGE